MFHSFTIGRLMTAAALMLLLAAAPRQAAARPDVGPGFGTMIGVQAGPSANGDALGRFVHRVVRRSENTTRRLQEVLSNAGVLWWPVLISTVMFLLVVGVSSAADLRMLQSRHRGALALARYLGRGMLTFFRILRDRRTPNVARLILVAAFLYWLLPMDFIPDQTLLPGFIDDLLVAIVAAKVFIYLCPDALVARHAAAVRAHA